VAYGATTKEVVEQLGMSFGAVKFELERIFEELGANDPPQAYGGDTVQLCQKHRCCYEVVLREGAGLPLNRAGEWHFTWVGEAGRWRLRYPARHITTERDVPEGVSPTVALIGAISGKTISHIADQIERLGFPPPDCANGRASRGQHVVKEPTELDATDRSSVVSGQYVISLRPASQGGGTR
jgi:hypothetical protein